MATGPTKRSSRPRSSAKPGKRSASIKPALRSTAASPSRQRNTPAGKNATPKRGTAARGRKVAGVRGAGRTGAVALLKTIMQSLGRIDEVHAELVNLRTVVEALVETISALVVDSEAQEREASTVRDDVVIVETYGVSANQEEPEPHGAAQD